MAPVSTFYVTNMREGYANIAQSVLERGEPVSPRGQLTRELRNVVIILDDPTDALPLGVNRGVNLSVAAVEALQLIAGQPAPQLVLRSAPNFRNYQEDDGTFWGNYGARVGLQLAAVVERLRAAPDSRQAPVQIWRADLDLMTDGKRDYPCTIGLYPLVRGGKLELTAVMRSNDVWLGLAYDVFQFTQFQLALAACLGVQPGQYVHHAISLHAYERDRERIVELESTPERGPIEALRCGLPGPDASQLSATHLLVAARQLLRGEEDPEHLQFLDAESAAWYREKLEPLR